MVDQAEQADQAKAQEQELSPLDAFLNASHTQLEQVRTKLSEINMLIEQSQGEVDKLAQRNADITNRLHQIQSTFETVPREDILSAYEAAQDAQQRLFTMRGQLEKLESDKIHLERQSDLLTDGLTLLEGNPEIETVDLEEKANNAGSVIEEIIDAQEEERRRLSRQIHDGPAQALSNFILQTEIAMRLFESDPDKAREELASLKDSASSTFGKVRDFIFDLRPMMLDDLGLAPTVRRYSEAFEEKSGLDINCVITGTERRIASTREVMVFRAVQEFLANVREHAQATQVKIMLDMDDHQVRAVVEDNGKGLDKANLNRDDDLRPGGLKRLRDRVEQLGGTLDTDGSESGTRTILVLPTGD
ncbi:MAG: histidine kinase [Anaerolineales bacterium]|jgi:two-component system sensor histidine kinase DegS